MSTKKQFELIKLDDVFSDDLGFILSSKDFSLLENHFSVTPASYLAFKESISSIILNSLKENNPSDDFLRFILSLTRIAIMEEISFQTVERLEIWNYLMEFIIRTNSLNWDKNYILFKLLPEEKVNEILIENKSLIPSYTKFFPEKLGYFFNTCVENEYWHVAREIILDVIDINQIKIESLKLLFSNYYIEKNQLEILYSKIDLKYHEDLDSIRKERKEQWMHDFQEKYEDGNTKQMILLKSKLSFIIDLFSDNELKNIVKSLIIINNPINEPWVISFLLEIVFCRNQAITPFIDELESKIFENFIFFYYRNNPYALLHKKIDWFMEKKEVGIKLSKIFLQIIDFSPNRVLEFIESLINNDFHPIDTLLEISRTHHFLKPQIEQILKKKMVEIDFKRLNMEKNGSAYLMILLNNHGFPELNFSFPLDFTIRKFRDLIGVYDEFSYAFKGNQFNLIIKNLSYEEQEFFIKNLLKSKENSILSLIDQYPNLFLSHIQIFIDINLSAKSISSYELQIINLLFTKVDKTKIPEEIKSEIEQEHNNYQKVRILHTLGREEDATKLLSILIGKNKVDPKFKILMWMDYIALNLELRLVKIDAEFIEKLIDEVKKMHDRYKSVFESTAWNYFLKYYYLLGKLYLVLFQKKPSEGNKQFLQLSIRMFHKTLNYCWDKLTNNLISNLISICQTELSSESLKTEIVNFSNLSLQKGYWISCDPPFFSKTRNISHFSYLLEIIDDTENKPLFSWNKNKKLLNSWETISSLRSDLINLRFHIEKSIIKEDYRNFLLVVRNLNDEREFPIQTLKDGNLYVINFKLNLYNIEILSSIELFFKRIDECTSFENRLPLIGKIMPKMDTLLSIIEDELFITCEILQNRWVILDFAKEIPLNDLVTDFLRQSLKAHSIDVDQEERGGISSVVEAEQDIVFFYENFKITILEALLNRNTPKKHYEKLIGKYDSLGRKRNYLLIYCTEEDFDSYVDYYKKLIAHSSFFERFEPFTRTFTSTELTVIKSIQKQPFSKMEVIHILVHLRKK